MNPVREWLVPAKGLKIPNPETPGKFLPDAGIAVTVQGGRNDSYWVRRKRAKDVAVGTMPEQIPDPVDPVRALLAGSADQVKAGLSELSVEALNKALATENASTKPRAAVVKAIQAEIDSRSSNK